MREGLVANVEGDFGDIEFVSGEELGGFFDAEGAEVEGKGFACSLFDEAAEVVGGATDIACEIIEIEGFIEPGLKERECLPDVAVGIFLNGGAEKRLRIDGLMEEVKRKHFQGFGQKPGLVAFEGNRRVDDVVVKLLFPGTPASENAEILPDFPGEGAEGLFDGFLGEGEEEKVMFLAGPESRRYDFGGFAGKVEEGERPGKQGQAGVRGDHESLAGAVEDHL